MLEDFELYAQENGIVILSVFAEFNQDIKKIFHENKIDAVCLGGLYGVRSKKLKSFDVLKSVSSKVKWLWSPKVTTTDGLEQLQSIERIDYKISTYHNDFDYRKLKNLKILNFGGESGSEVKLDYLNHDGIEDLKIGYIKSNDLHFLSLTSKLKRLALDCFSMESLDGISKLTSLEELRLLYSKKLEKIDDLSGLKKIEILEIGDAPKVTEISSIHHLNKLKYLILYLDKAKQENIQWLSNIPELECAAIGVETANVEWDIVAKHKTLYEFYVKVPKEYQLEKEIALQEKLMKYGKEVLAIDYFNGKEKGVRIKFKPSTNIKAPKSIMAIQKYS